MGDRSRRADEPALEALRLHPFYRGKIQTALKCPVRTIDDFAVWYTPGVAASSRAIAADPELVYSHTNKANTVAIVSDGSRVLGLGDIGPEAGLAVMEGKALLFKYLGGVDAVPICVDAHSADDIVRLVEMLQPSFGAVNLEDISQPKCFEVLDRLRASMRIPVWHDDQQGTATVAIAALRNALEIVGKSIDAIDIAMIGMGAANVAVFRLLEAAGIDPGRVVACDSTGILGPHRHDVEQRQLEFRDKWRVCRETNARRNTGGLHEAITGADVCIAFAKPGPDTIEPAWITEMADDAIVFACANPTPEIWPWDATEAGARIVCTGRSDFPNQVNNSLGFPGIFRGVLDVRASSITDEMALAASDVLADYARRRGLEHGLLPTMTEWEVVPEIAAAVGMTAQRQGLAAIERSHDELVASARATIETSREATNVLMEHGIIPEPPPAPSSDESPVAKPLRQLKHKPSERTMNEHTTQTGRPSMSPDEIRAHNEHDHLAAVFADRPHAVDAVDELRSLGLGSEHLGIAVHGDDAVAFEHDASAELLRDVERGALAGAPIGAIAGISLVALTASGIGAVAVGGMLAMAGASAVLGGVLGASLGAVAGESGWIEHENIGYAALKPGEVLVVVCSHGDPDAVREVLQRHAGWLHTIEAGQI